MDIYSKNSCIKIFYYFLLTERALRNQKKPHDGLLASTDVVKQQNVHWENKSKNMVVFSTWYRFICISWPRCLSTILLNTISLVSLMWQLKPLMYFSGNIWGNLERIIKQAIVVNCKNKTLLMNLFWLRSYPTQQLSLMLYVNRPAILLVRR